MTDPHTAVPQLIYRYCRALDRLDLRLFDAVFADDAEIDMGAIYRGGLEGFKTVAAQFMGSMAATRHEVANVLVEADGDCAAVESYVTAWHRVDGDQGPHELLVRARYLGIAECRGGRWWLVRHSEVVDWGATTPADAAWFDANAELPKGRRDRGDASYMVLA